MVITAPTPERKPTGELVYSCTSCGTETERELLMVRKVSFHLMGRRGRMIRSRTTDWLCPACVSKDTAWKQEGYHGSPGMQVEHG